MLRTVMNSVLRHVQICSAIHRCRVEGAGRRKEGMNRKRAWRLW